MEKTRLRLILDYPFFGSLALTMPLIATTDIPVASTNGIWIKYNPESLKEKQWWHKLFIYLHEICHVILGHTVRRGFRDRDVWGVACDHATNLMLKEMGGIRVPEDALCDEQYSGWSAERIYDKLMEPDGSVTGDPDTDTRGDQPVGHSPDTERMIEASRQSGTIEDTPPESDVTEESIRASVTMMERMTSAAGHSPPARIRELVEVFTDPKVGWRSLLAKFIYESCQDFYRWMRPNRRYSGGNVIMPSLNSNEAITLAVVLDTSGSIDEHLLSEFMKEFKILTSSINYKEIIMMSCSDEVLNPVSFKKGEDIDYTPHGDRSTSFAPVFEYLNGMNPYPACLIYFTDLFSEDFGRRPGCPLLWIGDFDDGWMEHHRGRVPFGQIVSMHGKN